MKPKSYDQKFLSIVNTKVRSIDGKVYVSKTCHLQVSKSQVPCLAVANDVYLDEIPEAIKILNKLETHLLRKMLFFKKVVIMARRQSPKLIGGVVNVLMNVNETFDKLSNCDHIVLMKLKLKLMFDGHAFFKPVNLETVRRALTLLKQGNHFYSDVKIEIDSIRSSSCYFNEPIEIVDNT